MNSHDTYEATLMEQDTSRTIRRRIFAFLIDYVVIAIVLMIATFVIAFLGLITFGVGWLLFAIMAPLVVGPYIAFTLGGPDQATPGMKMMGIRVIRDDGKATDPLFAIIYAVLFWALVSVLTPLSLLVALFTKRKRTLHDILLGAAVTRD